MCQIGSHMQANARRRFFCLGPQPLAGTEETLIIVFGSRYMPSKLLFCGQWVSLQIAIVSILPECFFSLASPRICTHFHAPRMRTMWCMQWFMRAKFPIRAAAAHFCKAIKTDVNTSAKSRKLQPHPKPPYIRGSRTFCVNGWPRRLFMPIISDCVPWDLCWGYSSRARTRARDYQQ